MSDRTAGLLITNPEDTGIFNARIAEFTDLVHEAGGLCGYDQANANGILGITRAKEAGFDMCFFNLHKTFGTPHGCGGPAGGVIGAAEHLVPFLPVPLVSYRKKKGRYVLDYDLPKTIGKMKDFYGHRAGRGPGLRLDHEPGGRGAARSGPGRHAEQQLRLPEDPEMKGAGAPPYAEGEHRMEQVRYSFQKLKDETGLDIADVQNRIFDYAGHIWSSHEPFIVPEPFTIEPTESYSKDELDEYVAVLGRIVEEAYTDPEILRHAPHRSVVHHIDHDYLEDPARWAITWRMYRKRFDGYFQPKGAEAAG